MFAINLTSKKDESFLKIGQTDNNISFYNLFKFIFVIKFCLQNVKHIEKDAIVT